MKWIALAIVAFGVLLHDGLTNIGKGLNNIGMSIFRNKEDTK